ncbi:MAG: membrane protein insertion efficiency factor YidD [Bacteroidota bacterium]|nr:membrane protein insertion efficiency factor YidD [Bacteroidota bacterium]
MKWQKLLRKIYIIPIQLYRWILSPILPNACRYTPTCSKYCMEAILKHGILMGTKLGIKRICKCHPWGGYGHDPVP